MDICLFLSVCLNVLFVLYFYFTYTTIRRHKRSIEKDRELKQVRAALARAFIPSDVTQLILSSKHFLKTRKSV